MLIEPKSGDETQHQRMCKRVGWSGPEGVGAVSVRRGDEASSKGTSGLGSVSATEWPGLGAPAAAWGGAAAMGTFVPPSEGVGEAPVGGSQGDSNTTTSTSSLSVIPAGADDGGIPAEVGDRPSEACISVGNGGRLGGGSSG